MARCNLFRQWEVSWAMFAHCGRPKRLFALWQDGNFFLHLLAVFSAVLSILTLVFASDPSRRIGRLRPTEQHMQNDLRVICDFTARNRTFVLIVLQGLFGVVPYTAMTAYSDIFLQYIGISNFKTGVITSQFYFGSIAGGALGGRLGDIMSGKFAAQGRLRVAQTSVALGAITGTIIFGGIPRTLASSSAFAIAFLVLGLTATWSRVACIQPILAEIVPPDFRATVLAWEYSLEGVFGALVGGEVVGLCSEAFGYHSSNKSIADMTTGEKERNSAAISRTLCLMYAVGNSMCCCFFGLVISAYSREQRASFHETHQVTCPPEGQDNHAGQDRTASDTASGLSMDEEN